jgi:hypothetical protein
MWLQIHYKVVSRRQPQNTRIAFFTDPNTDVTDPDIDVTDPNTEVTDPNIDVTDTNYRF